MPKTEKKHRTKKKNEKRKSDGLNYNTQPSVSDSANRGNVIKPVVIEKKKKETYNPGKNAPKPGKVYDPVKARINKLKKSNSLIALGTGISDTVKSFKKKKS
ncbi:MAG: hypothetical protein GY760_22345 [Deltaproteobacteria bacterium]|jgi:hypothetical protein|nr:hypothetical protein [Deltaproteobacteria bacterium]